MASRKTKWWAGGGLAVVLGSGYFIYSLIAAQGQGNLSQTPLNIQKPVPPAFVMALDDSGSMVWETLNNTRDGVYHWRDGTGFYNGSTPYGYDLPSGSGLRYYYLTPPYGRGSDAIPPLDAFGFARSADVNGAYFDPRENYPAWKTGSSSTNPAEADYMQIDPDNAPVDPRPGTATGKSTLFQKLTAVETRTGSNWRFRFRNGMVLPVGTVIETAFNRGAETLLCTTNPTLDSRNTSTLNGSWRTLTRQVTVSGDCSAAMQYFPATFYLVNKASLPASYGYTATPVEVTNPAGGRPGTIYKYEIKPDNFATTAQYNDAIKNFARWFSFYRTRREALIGAATNALLGTSNLRVGWFRINDRAEAKMYSMTDEDQKKALFTDIIGRMRATGNTPNRRAVEYLGQQFKRTDAGAPVQLSCQKNAGMLFTDGYINDDYTAKSMTTLVKPFYDDSLVPGLETNTVPVPAECTGTPAPGMDCKTSLHMNFYGVTLGTLGKLYGVTYLPEPARPWVLTPNPYTTPPPFLNTIENLTPNAVDEMWRATLATKGEMINATRPSQITAAMRRIIDNVSQGKSPSGTKSLTGARIGTGSLSVEPFYEVTKVSGGTDWYSYLTAFSLAIDPTTRTLTSTNAWEASAKMPASGARNIRYWNNGSVSEFSADTVTLARLCDTSVTQYPGIRICSESEITGLAGNAASAVAYLRGDRSREKPAGTLRARTTVLGDIINSGPVLTSPIDDYGYRNLPDVGDSYVQYLADKREDRRYMVYAGANDGMLHAFDGGAGVDGVQDSEGGKEVFAYMPSTSLFHLGDLLLPYDPLRENNQRFEHRYFVDGPVVVADTHYDSEWHTSLVGTAGAGGRSVFALDVTDPTGFDNESLLWEISDLNTALDETVRLNIGHVLGKPVIVPVKAADGTVSWKAIFGNGYRSASGKAVLFVVDMAADTTPTITMIEAAETGSNLPSGANGLGNIVAVDRWGGDDQDQRSRDGYADTVYAADQKGAVWKFDLRTNEALSVPVFTTKVAQSPVDGRNYRQPITGGLTATAGPSGGVMLLFGTGSFIFESDADDKVSVQALYGVNDTSIGPALTTLTADNLTPYTVSGDTGARQLVLGTAPSPSSGWTIQLPAGERSIGNPVVTSGVLFIPTYVPNPDQAGCSTDGSNWLFGVSASNGSAALSQVRYGSPTGESPGAGTAGVSLDTGGNAPVRDVTLGVVPRLTPPPPGTPGTPPPSPPGNACWMTVNVAGAESMYLPYPCGRQSWRQIQ